MWKHRIWYLAVLLTAVTVYIVADRREALVFMCFLVVVPFLSAIVQQAAMRGIRAGCRVQETCRMGQGAAVRFCLYRKNRLPLGAVRIHVVFENILYGETEEKEVCLMPSEHKEMAFVYRFEAADCGNVKIRASVMECRDLLGLFVFRHPFEVSEEILVYPPQIRLHTELFQRPETKNFGEMYDQHKKGQDVSEVSGLRDYIPGDAMNSIHWKLSGKLDRLIVREFGRPSHYNTLLLYEMMRNAKETEVPNIYNNAVLALTVSLSMSMLGLDLEHNVGRVFGRELQALPVNSIDTHEQMQLSLLCAPMAREENGTDTVYSLSKGNLKGGYTKIVYITPYHEESTARQLAGEADLTVIQIVQGKGMDCADAAGYTVVSVDVDTYQDTMHNITI